MLSSIQERIRNEVLLKYKNRIIAERLSPSAIVTLLKRDYRNVEWTEEDVTEVLGLGKEKLWEHAWPLDEEAERQGKKRRLTDRQRHLMDSYLLQIRPIVEAGDISMQQIVETIAKNHQFIISPAVLYHRVGANGQLYKHEWPQSEACRKGRQNSATVLRMVQNLAEHCRVQHEYIHVLRGQLLAANIICSPVPKPAALNEVLNDLTGFNEATNDDSNLVIGNHFPSKEEALAQ